MSLLKAQYRFQNVLEITPEFLKSAAACSPKRIVYISCNPETQVRDILVLKKLGYAPKICIPVDMFPHTEHIETVVLLSIKNEKNL